MTPDEVIAGNVRRIREERDLSVVELAERLRVGRHIVYDYERPRPGAEQRAFLWTDLVKLCDVLEVSLFDLVLPPSGEPVEGYTFREQDTAGMPEGIAVEIEKDGRSVLAEMVFGVPPEMANPQNLELLLDKRQKQSERFAAAFQPFMEEALAKFEEIGKDDLRKETDQ